MNPGVIALRYQRIVYLLIAGLILFGTLSYFTMPAREDPQITIREAVITTHYSGLRAERVELLITKPLEKAIRAMAQVKEIRSSSFTGTSIIHVELYDHFDNLEQLWDELRRRVNEAAPDLPDGAQAPRINTDFSDVAVMTVAITGSDYDQAQLTEAAENLEDAVYEVPGTRRVDLFGTQPERIYVELAASRLADLGVDASTVYQTLTRQNLIRPGGTMEIGDQRIPIRVSGAYRSVESVRNTLIQLPGLALPIPLRDLGNVYRAPLDPPRSLAYYQGQAAVVAAIAMDGSYRVLEYSERLRRQVEQLQHNLPAGLKLNVITDQSQAVSRAVYGVSANVLQTLAAVAAVVVLFLGMRTGLIVGSIVPAVMLATIAFMAFSGMALERMSLATLVIALGLLVDNGIVIAEDFKQRLAKGEHRKSVLASTSKELALPLLSSTLTTILVFLPLMLSEHISGEYTRSISLVILISLLLSWLIAITLTPLLCYHFTRVPEHVRQRQPASERIFASLSQRYAGWLRRILVRPMRFLLTMLALLALAGVALAFAPQQFFPDSDRPQVQVFVDLPAEASIEVTDRAIRELGDLLETTPLSEKIRDYAAYVGSGGPRFVLAMSPMDPAPNRGYLIINAHERKDASALIEQLRSMIPERFPQLSAQVTGMYLGPSDSTQLAVRVNGPDAEVLYATAQDVFSILESLPGAIHVRQSWDNRIPHLSLDVDQARARQAGINSEDVTELALSHTTGRTVSVFYDGDERLPVVIRSPSNERQDPLELAGRWLTGQHGQPVPLGQIADLALDWGYGRIERLNMTRSITVQSRNTRMTAEDMVPLVEPALDTLRADLPPGHTITFDGVVLESAEARNAITANLPLCLAVAALLLILQFNSLRRAGLIFATIPLLIIGATLGLYIMGAEFGFMPLLGLYALAGILVNNAIVLIAQIEIERQRNDDILDAITNAAQRRLRPILITTITTVVGLLPLIVFQDALFYGMASVIAFGLMIGTVLTLAVVPALYMVLFKTTSTQDQVACC